MDVEWIKRGLEQPGKSKKGLAAAIGRSPPVVTDILKGNRPLKLDEVPKIVEYLEVEPPRGLAHLILAPRPGREREQPTAQHDGDLAVAIKPDIEQAPELDTSISGVSDGTAERSYGGYLAATAKMPILAGKKVGWSEMVIAPKPNGHVTRPWFVAEIEESFGLIVSTANMAPVIEPRDTIIVNEILPAAEGKEAIFRSAKRDDGVHVIIARLLGETKEDWKIQEFAPQHKTSSARLISKSEWPDVFAIVAKLFG